MDCSTIIVSYNTYALTREAIEAALAAASGMEHEVIVVDNASPDGSAERLRTDFPEERFPNVTVIAARENAGFAAANNRGAAVARGRILYFLNSDTIARRDSTRILCSFLQAHPEAGAVGPRVFNADGTDQASTAEFPSAGRLLRYHLPVLDALRGRDRRRDAVPETTGPVDIVKGCALAMTQQAFDEVGGWDESYFLYAEETELCHQLARRGYTNYVVREAEIVHLGGASAATDDYVKHQLLNARSAAVFMRRHRPAAEVFLDRAAGAVGFGVRALVFRLLALRRTESAESYRLRGRAASALWRWFLFRYS